MSATLYPAPVFGVDEPTTDLGNARRLIATHHEDLRYATVHGKWLVWDGQRWKPDDTDEVERRAKATVRGLLRSVVRIEDEDKRKAHVKWAMQSEYAGRIRAMIDLAESEPGVPVTPGQLDADPWVLNVANGTLDLRSGTLREHRRDDLITKLAPVAYDAAAECPLWLEFLRTIFARDDALIAYVQRAVGYSLTATTREQVMFVLYGTGANGKSTLLNVVKAMLGDYAMHSPTETFLQKQGGGIPNDQARLHGARFVTAVEAEGGRKLAEATVKQMTGGDPVTARFMYGEFFEFVPVFKLWLAVNHKPSVQGTDHAIWRRIHLIPFAVTITDDMKDRELGNKLVAELSGILRWAVAGCLNWQRVGLATPTAVLAATADYREEMDTLGEFIGAACILDPEAEVTTERLYDAYTAWCQVNEERPVSKREFGMRLRERGFQPYRRSTGRGWRGLGVTEQPMTHDGK